MQDTDLVRLALAAKQYAYVPYSHYRVGAALLTSSGEVYTGCNIENASFGLTVCAERTALFKAVSEGQRAFEALAIAVDGEALASPCGACRQVMVEFAPQMRCILANGQGEHKTTTVEQLLPDGFNTANLEKGVSR